MRDPRRRAMMYSMNSMASKLRWIKPAVARLRRFGPRVLGLGSLMISLACAVFWARGGSRYDAAWYESALSDSGRSYGICLVSWSGRFLFELDLNRPFGDEGLAPRAKGGWHSATINAPGETWDLRYNATPSDVSFLGMKFYYSRINSLVSADTVAARSVYGLAVPWPILTLLFALPLPLWIAKRTRCWRRAKRGGCIHCGYDLRATVEKCPECGEPIAAERPKIASTITPKEAA